MTSKRKIYEASEVTAIEAQLKELPANTREKQLSTRSVVERLSPTICSLVDQGYSLDEVREFLAMTNVDIATSTLRRYLSDMEKRVQDAQRISPAKTTGMRLKKTKNISAVNTADTHKSV